MQTPSLSPSLSLRLCFYRCLSVCLFFCLCFCLPVSVSVFTSLSLCFYLCHPDSCLSLTPCLSLCFSVSVIPYLSLSSCLLVYVSVFLSVCLCPCLSIWIEMNVQSVHILLLGLACKRYPSPSFSSTPSLHPYASVKGRSIFWLLHTLHKLVPLSRSTSTAEDPGVRFPFVPWGFCSGSSHTSDLKIDTPVATLQGAWRYRVSAGTGWPGVSIL